MDSAEQLRILEAAQGDPAKLALATVELAYPALPDAERARLKASLEAAAIPHWCDEAILAVLLEIPLADSTARLTQLRGLTVVERFPARGETAVNAHEAARLAIRTRLAREDVDRFRRLSALAVRCFEQDRTPAKRIEWIYHLLCAEPERGATELEKLDRDWSSSAHPEDRYALASALQELENSMLVRGRARVSTLLVIAWSAVERGESARQADVAHEAMRLARTMRDERSEADAQCLLGDSLRAQGKLGDAQAAFGEYLRISRQLAEQDPSNAGWQRDLAVAFLRLARVDFNGGRHAAALPLYEEAARIFDALLERAPDFVQWASDKARIEQELAACRQQVQSDRGSK